MKSLGKGESAVLAKVEAPFAGEVGEPGLPAAGSPTGGDAFGAGQGDELTSQAQLFAHEGREVGPLVAPPEFGTHAQVGSQGDEVIEGGGGTTPAIDAGVKVKGHDTHLSDFTP
jgi:hypothetical protein